MKKYLKKFVFFFIIISFSLFFNNGVNAKFAQYYSDIKHGDTHITQYGVGTSMYLKYSGSNSISDSSGIADPGRPLICVTYDKTSPANKEGVVCAIVQPDAPNGYKVWSKAGKAAVASIIRRVDGDTYINNSNTTENNRKYFCAELILNQWLWAIGGDVYGGHKFGNYAEAVSKASCPSDAYDLASKVYVEVSNPHKISIDATNLVFTKSKDGYYYSNTIKVSTNKGNFDSSIISYEFIGPILSNNDFEYEDLGNGKYRFKISSDKIRPGETKNLKVDFSSKRKYHIAEQYDCGDEYQTVTPAYTELYAEQPNASTISGSITKGYVEFRIGKVNEHGFQIPGAELMLQTEEQYKNKQPGTKYTSDIRFITVKNVVPGTYYLTETKAPSGYIKSDKVVKIEVDNDDNIKVDGKPYEEMADYIRAAYIINIQTKTIISKEDATNGKLISGATLQILDADKNPVKLNGKDLKWITEEGEKHYIYGLEPGIYYLQELSAPEGYTLNTELVKFEVKNANVDNNVLMKNSPIVPVEDTASNISIIMTILGIFLLGVGLLTVFYVIRKRQLKF